MKLHCLSLVAVVMSGSLSWSQSLQPVCTTYFYNQSDVQWVIANIDGKQRMLFVPPHTTATITWGPTRYIVLSNNAADHALPLRFEVEPFGSCVVISSQRPLGGVSLNQPSNGDIRTCTGGCTN